METMDAYNVYSPPPEPGKQPGDPKKQNTMLIIGIIVLVILCCCISVGALVGLWFFGDQLMEMLGVQVMRFMSFI